MDKDSNEGGSMKKILRLISPWTVSVSLCLFFIISMYITNFEKLLLPIWGLLTLCCIEELLLKKKFNGDESIIELLKIPFFVEILIMFLLSTKFEPDYNVVNWDDNCYAKICMMTSLVVGLIRGYFRYIKEDGFSIAIIVGIGFPIVMYFCISAQFISMIDVQLDRNQPQVIEAKVIDKGYIYYGGFGAGGITDTKKYMGLNVKTEEYGKFTLGIMQNDYDAIEVGETIDVNVGLGLLGIKYVYYHETKLEYPLIKSTFWDKDFRRYLKDQKELPQL